MLQHDCQEFLALLLDSLHEHLNSSCASSSTHKLTTGSHSESFNQSESSDVDVEFDDATAADDRPVNDAQSPPGESFGSFQSQNEQLLVDMGTEDSSAFARSETNPLQPLDCTVMDVEMVDHCDSIVDDNSENERKVPSIEDFCSKDTKTLNTNVLIAETTEELATDSDKFHKMENTAELSATSADESLDDEVTTDSQLHELLLAACDGSISKPVKETNLVANCREKFVDSLKMTHPVTAYARNSTADVECFISTMKQFCGKPAGVTTEPDDDVHNYDNINNIKRIKIDDQAEKNLRMQVKLKVNTEQNQTRSSTPPVADCTASNAVPADQLIASSSSPVTVTAAGSQNVPSSAASCTGDVITARHIRRAEDAWLAYISRNRSVIVDTFQGQFKSTVSYHAFCLFCYDSSLLKSQDNEHLQGTERHQS